MSFELQHGTVPPSLRKGHRSQRRSTRHLEHQGLKKETRWGSAEPQRVLLFTGSWQLCQVMGRIPKPSYLFRRLLPHC
jgi:hypothetical protein